ncbi:catabolite repressor/activator [Utexia brackfieldae]|uniref:catabolite repressor/activator n=1 Tax=Utexia brackfieldae TaxID=3074108 RepID=UPI00370DDD06
MKLEEIARLAGVSRTTASYVINGKAKQYRVSDKTIEKVLAVVKQHQFQPNAIAAGLRAGRTSSLGLVIPDLENLSYTRIANYLERFAREQGYQLLISCSEDQPELEIQCIRHLQQRRVDAVIVSSSFSEADEFYLNWDNRALPIFALDRSIDPARFCTITGSDFYDAKMLAEAFEQHAGSKVVYMGALSELPISGLREHGFKTVMSEDNRDIHLLYADSFTRQDAEKTFTDWLNRSPLPNPIPNAIFVTSFTLLQGIIDAILKRLGYLPNDLLIATFGDNELLDFLPCPIISVTQQHKEIAHQTLSRVLNCLESHQYQANLTIINRTLIYRGGLRRERLR